MIRFAGDADGSSMKNILHNLKNHAKMLSAVGKVIAYEVSENFRQRGRPRWKGNASLQKSGKLRNAATSVKVNGSMAVVGDDLDKIPYAKAHELGKGKLPKRSFMKLPASVSEKIRTVVQKILFGGEK